MIFVIVQVIWLILCTVCEQGPGRRRDLWGETAQRLRLLVIRMRLHCTDDMADKWDAERKESFLIEGKQIYKLLCL